MAERIEDFIIEKKSSRWLCVHTDLALRSRIEKIEGVISVYENDPLVLMVFTSPLYDQGSIVADIKALFAPAKPKKPPRLVGIERVPIVEREIVKAYYNGDFGKPYEFEAFQTRPYTHVYVWDNEHLIAANGFSKCNYPDPWSRGEGVHWALKKAARKLSRRIFIKTYQYQTIEQRIALLAQCAKWRLWVHDSIMSQTYCPECEEYIGHDHKEGCSLVGHLPGE